MPHLIRICRSTLWPGFGLILLTVPTALGQGEAETLSTSFRKSARRVLPAVVTVRPQGVPSPFPGIMNPVSRPDREPNGSGVVIDASKGFVLTNDHVIASASAVSVVLPNGRERVVTQVRRDPKSDLALLTIDPNGLVQADWGDSNALDTGDWVLAIGQPFGLSGTVTAGIVSGKARGIGVALYEDLLQTDAAINPGNSGGPLVNMKGEVVGINTAIKTLSGGYEGVGFAVPSSRARRVASDLAEFGKVRRAHLGVTIRPVEPEVADRLGVVHGALVTTVTNPSPAATAGLRSGDVITMIDDKPLDGPGSLQAQVEVAKVGEPMKLGVARGDKILEIQVKPEVQPDRFGAPVQAGQTPGININVPGARVNVPGPNMNLGTPAPGAIISTPANPADAEPDLNPLPPAIPAPGGTAPNANTPKDSSVIRSTPKPSSPAPESSTPSAPSNPPKTTSNFYEIERMLLQENVFT